MHVYSGARPMTVSGAYSQGSVMGSQPQVPDVKRCRRLHGEIAENLFFRFQVVCLFIEVKSLENGLCVFTLLSLGKSPHIGMRSAAQAHPKNPGWKREAPGL